MAGQKKKRKRIGILPILAFLAGIGILLYPTVSNYYNTMHSSNAIMEYAENLAAMDNERIRGLWAEALEYNDFLYRAQQGEELPEHALKNYDEILQVDDSGMMGYIDIPKINVHLPIYHGTDEGILQKGIGHLEWTSFPTGGESVHTVLTGHTGLPSARLFTDLDQLTEGDVFVIRILGEDMAYKVDSIETVLPSETASLAIERGADRCSLITCTPYGVNSHRLLVHGTRTEEPQARNTIEEAQTETERSVLKPMVVMLIIAGVLVVILLVLIFKKKKKKTEKNAGSVKKKTE